MAKKNFKKGIGSLIQDSFTNQQNESQNEQSEQKSNQEVKKLQKQIQDLKAQLKLQEDELHKWRTGKLTVDTFHESLKKYNLEYNPEENSFKATK